MGHEKEEIPNDIPKYWQKLLISNKSVLINSGC